MSLNFRLITAYFFASFPGLVTALALALAAAFPAMAVVSSIENAFTPSQHGTAQFDHSAWDRLLKTYVRPDTTGLNRVDYKAFKAQGHKALKDYIETLTKVDVTRLGRDEQFAYWVNLYNALTIDIVLDHYPISSIKDITFGRFFASGPWWKKLVTVAGIKLSLDDIEHKILRGLFKDNRVHYAVNCASIGCPNLARDAFTGARLNTQLDQAARAYIAHPRGVQVKGRRVTVSKIYRWFKADFGGSDDNILNHIRRYASSDLKAKLAGIKRIYDTVYDWSLNDVK